MSHGSGPLAELAAEGAAAAAADALRTVREAVEVAGPDAPLSLPGVSQGLPLLRAWRGSGTVSLREAEELLLSLPPARPDEWEAAAENAMLACEVLEAAGCILGRPCGAVPDAALEELGLSLVDDTVPGIAVLLGGGASDAEIDAAAGAALSRGMAAVSAAGRPFGDRVRRREGAGALLRYAGGARGAVHALGLAVRASLAYGGVRPGDRERLREHLGRHVRIVVLQNGPADGTQAAMALAAALHGGKVVTDGGLPCMPDVAEVCADRAAMLQAGIEFRGVPAKPPIDEPPAESGPAFEGELIGDGDMFLEAGGGSAAFELLRCAPADEVEDGRVTLTGPDADSLEAGSSVPLALIVRVYGRSMRPELEPAMESRIHAAVCRIRGAQHEGRRDEIRVRIGREAVGRGLSLAELGRAAVRIVRGEFGRTVTRASAEVVTDPAEVARLLPAAREAYAERDARSAGLSDDAVAEFYSCTMCQSVAPFHVCIVSPERPGLCGAIAWADARAGSELSPEGPFRPVPKGAPVDPGKGEWEGVDAAVRALSSGRTERLCMYSLMDAPMTSCRCPEAVVAAAPDMRGVVVVDRGFEGMTPAGAGFRELAACAADGRQSPGFMGVGKKYITSHKFITAEGGIRRVVWMPRRLKESLGPELGRLCAEAGAPDLPGMIADETVAGDAESLAGWVERVGHPAGRMGPLLQERLHG